LYGLIIVIILLPAASARAVLVVIMKIVARSSFFGSIPGASMPPRRLLAPLPGRNLAIGLKASNVCKRIAMLRMAGR
jgi:hypothetical protein